MKYFLNKYKDLIEIISDVLLVKKILHKEDLEKIVLEYEKENNKEILFERI